MKTIDLDEGKTALYKSFELQPTQKFFVQTGEEHGNRVMDTLQYLASLTLPRDLSWLGLEGVVVRPMDIETAKFIRDHAIYSKARRITDQGMARQYGRVLLEGQSGPNSLIGTGSAIALVQEKEDGTLHIARKNKMGLDNKQAGEIIPEFHNFEEQRNDDIIPGNDSIEQQRMDGEEAFMHEQLREAREEPPPLREEKTPPLKKKTGGKPSGKPKLPWMRRRSR